MRGWPPPYSNDLKEIKMLTLEETKLHLRIDHDEEDTLIGALIATAIAATANYLNMAPELLTGTTPGPIKSAALLLIGTLYSDRESQSERPYNHNPTFDRLLAP